MFPLACGIKKSSAWALVRPCFTFRPQTCAAFYPRDFNKSFPNSLLLQQHHHEMMSWLHHKQGDDEFTQKKIWCLHGANFIVMIVLIIFYKSFRNDYHLSGNGVQQRERSVFVDPRWISCRCALCAHKTPVTTWRRSSSPVGRRTLTGVHQTSHPHLLRSGRDGSMLPFCVLSFKKRHQKASSVPTDKMSFKA